MGQHRRSLKRRDSDPPAAIAKWGWRYHHLGVPTEVARAGERYLERFKMYVTGFESSPYGIEWMRFEEGSPVPEIIRTVPHLAFEVDDLEMALQGKEVLTPPNSPSNGVVVAMIIHDGAPIELLQFGQRSDSLGEEAMFAPGAAVTFRWRLIAMLPDWFSFVVGTSRTGNDELCRSEREICTTTLDDEADHEWWAESLRGAQSISQKQSTDALHPRAGHSYPHPHAVSHTDTDRHTAASGRRGPR